MSQQFTKEITQGHFTELQGKYNTFLTDSEEQNKQGFNFFKIRFQEQKIQATGVQNTLRCCN